jgi:hypothetical protein
MRRRRWWSGVCVGGVALVTLVPVAAAGATSKGAMCRAVTTEENGADTVGLSLERAVASGNFAASKAAMLRAYGTDQRNVTKALGAAKSAPPRVRSAFENLLSFVRQVRHDIASSKNLPALETSFERLAKNPKLVRDGAAIEQWATSVCTASSAG